MLELLSRMDRAARKAPFEAALALAALGFVAYAIIAPFAAAPYPPMTDFPFHAAFSGAFRHYFDPAYHFRDQFDIRPIGVPYLSMYVIAALLMTVLPTITALKVAGAIMLALVPAGLAVMFHGMKKSPLLGLVGLGLCWCKLTHWGFLNFVGALGLFAMTIGLTLLLVDRPSRRRQWALGIALVALFFTHIFRHPFALAGVVGTALVMYPATRRIRPIVAPLIPATVLFVIWYVVRPRAIGTDPGPVALHTERFKEFYGLLSGGFMDPAEQKAFDSFGTTLLYVGIACAVILVIRTIAKAPRRGSWLFHVGATLAVLCCAGAFVLLFLTLPMAIGDWWYVYPREATAASVIALGLFPDLPRSIFLRAPLVFVLGFSGLGISSVVVKNYAPFGPATRDFDAIIREIPRAPKLLYLVFDHGGTSRETTPFIHLPAYVQALRGGSLSFHFAVWNTATLGYKNREEHPDWVPPPTPLRWEWTPHIFDVKKHGPFFDWFLVRRRGSPDALFAADPTIERVDHIGTWWLYRRKSTP